MNKRRAELITLIARYRAESTELDLTAEAFSAEAIFGQAKMQLALADAVEALYAPNAGVTQAFPTGRWDRTGQPTQ